MNIDNFTEKRVKKVINKQFRIKKKIDNYNSFINDLGADSLDMIELFMSLEEEFNVEFLDEESENISTVQDIIDLIKKKIILKY